MVATAAQGGHAYPGERIKDVVEVDEDFALGDLCNVVHALAGVVSDASILVGEASKDGRHYLS